jgi:hypothetical protein
LNQEADQLPADDEQPPGPDLHYATDAPQLRRHRRRGRIVLAVTLLALAAFLAAALPKALREYRLLSLQSQCLDYMPAADSIVFDSRPQSMPQWSRSDPQTISGNLTGNIPFVAKVPVCWRAYYGQVYPPGMVTIGTAFLHRLRTPTGGQERLVAADLFHFKAHLEGIGITARVMIPGRLGRAPVERSQGGGEWLVFLPTDGTSIEFHAGQPDRQNADHFSIEYSADEKRSVVDGWLRDDDSVYFQVRSSPQARPIRPKPPR